LAGYGRSVEELAATGLRGVAVPHKEQQGLSALTWQQYVDKIPSCHPRLRSAHREPGALVPV
jgi:hypothetical protein